MNHHIRSIREALTNGADAPEPEKPKTAADAQHQEEVARASNERYRNFVAELNRAGDREMERALKRA